MAFMCCRWRHSKLEAEAQTRDGGEVYRWNKIARFVWVRQPQFADKCDKWEDGALIRLDSQTRKFAIPSTQGSQKPMSVRDCPFHLLIWSVWGRFLPMALRHFSARWRSFCSYVFVCGYSRHVHTPNDAKSVQYLTNGLAGNLVLISKECPLL